MRYGVRYYDSGAPGRLAHTLRLYVWFDTAEERDAFLSEARANGHYARPGESLRPIRILSHEEAKRKARADELRAMADKIEDHRADESYASAEIAFSMRARAAELWPEGE